MVEEKNIRYVDWTLRLALFGTFLGHGILAVMQKTKFVDMFTHMAALVGWTVSQPAAAQWVLWIGIFDIIVAVAILWKPIRILLIWAVAWGFLTALARPLGSEFGWNIFGAIAKPNVDNLWDLVERAANFGVPLALLFLRGIPKTWKDLFE